MLFATSAELATMSLEQLRAYGTELLANCRSYRLEDPRLMPAAADLIERMADPIEHGHQLPSMTTSWMGAPALHELSCERLSERNKVMRVVEERLAGETRRHRLEQAIFELIRQQQLTNELHARSIAGRRLAIAARRLAQDLRAEAVDPPPGLTPDDYAKIDVIFA